MVRGPWGSPEVNVQAIFEFANKLDHVEGIDAERFEGRILIDVLGRDVEVFLKNVFNGVERGHVRPLDVVQYHKTCHAPLIVALFRLFYAQGDNREAGKEKAAESPNAAWKAASPANAPPQAKNTMPAQPIEAHA